ncbi:MAG TPA: aminotransferase class V-fold PLP-dependent enzyme [Thermoanaerobaculia bacterium]|nr:aminotransferase class V-fold PLP-dependent enzyme [Thermoanaerobaculia bacterium]
MSKYPLEPDAAEMRRLVDEAMRRITAHIASLPDQPARGDEGAADDSRKLIEPLPRKGEAYETLLDRFFDDYVPRSFNAAGPGYLAYIPGGGLFYAAIADLIADSVNRYTGVFAAAPALVQLEANVVRWFCEIIGYGRGSGGILTTGGSFANFSAIVAARKKLLPENFLKGTLYCSTQVHHSFQKAANLAGFPYANIREVACDAKFRMRVDALEDAIARDQRGGFTPFLVIGSAGTTNTGAVDDLEAIGRVAKANGMWFHCDGAYGAFFMLTERGRSAMRGIEQADSIVLDPHKTFFLPYGTGGLVVKDASTLRRAHSLHADYLPDMQEDEELVDFCEISPELSKAYRGLRVWLPVKMFGIDVFRQQLDEKLDLTEWATAELRKIDGMEIVAEPQLSIVAFRLKGSDDRNRELLNRINDKKRVMLTPTVIDGQFIIRICVVSFRTHMDRMRMAIDDIRSAAQELR